MRALSVTALLVVTLVPAAHAAKIARLTVHPENGSNAAARQRLFLAVDCGRSYLMAM